MPKSSNTHLKNPQNMIIENAIWNFIMIKEASERKVA